MDLVCSLQSDGNSLEMLFFRTNFLEKEKKIVATTIKV